MTHLLARALSAVLIALLLLACVMLAWLFHPQSLGITLRYLPSFLSAADGLRVDQVEGSLMKGGTIGRLQWQADGLQIDIKDLRLTYDLMDLLERNLNISTAHAGQLRIDDQSPAKLDRTPPATLQLPLAVQIQARVDQLFVQGQQRAALNNVQFAYQFDGETHRIEQGQFQLASGRYQLRAQVQAQSPMQVSADLTGELQTPALGKKAAQTLSAKARLQGNLIAVDEALKLNVELAPKPLAKLPSASTTTLNIQADVQPWNAQPLARAQAQWKHLDPADFWPGIAHAQLAGQLKVQPVGDRWEAQISVDNTLFGPIDQQRVPLQNLQARLSYEHPSWVIHELQASTGAGELSGQGRLVDGSWQANMQVKRLQPQSVDSRWQGGTISGTINAQRKTDTLAFETNLHAQDWRGSATPEAWPVQLQDLQAKGTWSSAQLSLESLSVQTIQATAQGSGRYNHSSHDVELQLDMQAPGLRANVQGNLAAQRGQGQLKLQVQEATRASQWLAQWPVTKRFLQSRDWRGQAQLQGSWLGGWQDYRTGLNLDLTLQSPRLEWSVANAVRGASWEVRDLQTRLTGTPAALQISSDGSVAQGGHHLQWHTRSTAQIDLPNAQMAVQDLRLHWRPSATTKPWTAQLNTGATSVAETLLLRWNQTTQSQRLTVSAGSLNIKGPLPGIGRFDWAPSHWEQQANQSAQWQSQGQFKGLPASWMDAFSPQPIAELGLSSDLVLQGDWRLNQGDTLSAHALIERASGDLRLNTGDKQQPILPAELQDARLIIDMNNKAVAASLRWDSTRAGRALIAFSTTIDDGDAGWTWPQPSPVAASIQLQSPPAQAWTALAPPGWRLKGVVDANLTLSGTRAQPQWTGKIQARELALRSLVHGLDFDQGTLDATLMGQQLRIDHARLEGAGAGGGTLDVQGTLEWLTDDKLPKLFDRVRAKLMAQVQEFRVSTRPERRLIASGSLQASLERSLWKLGGTLKADHALITLPDDSAPTLGEDVLVRKIGGAAQASLVKASAATSPAPMAFDLRVVLDPGEDFQIRGRGLQGRLGGQLILQSKGPGTTQLSGTLNTVNSTYQAYGQRLNIEQGRLLFAGTLDNPTLDILAIRPQTTQRVGVQISGPALAPVVRLYADPDLPEVEKLSWLLTGRAASSGGAEAVVLQQAAMTLISGRNSASSKTLAQAFGLDVLSLQSKSSIGPSSAGNSTAPDANAASITLGKRLSNDVYVAYEHSLAGTVSAFSIFYELSQRFTLRAQTGEQTALDLIFTLRYD